MQSSGLIEFERPNFDGNEGKSTIEKDLDLSFKICQSPSFDYSAQLVEYQKEFERNFEQVKPSPHIKCVDFNHMPILGVGKFGTVRLMETRTGAFCALKILSKANIIKEKVVEKTIMEKNLLASANFPFIISLLFSNKDNDCLYIGLPFIGGGDLFNFHRKRIRFPEPMARFYSAQILLALEYLHNVKCVYRDLKPENILIDVTGYLKLTDFGLSKFLGDRTTTLCGTPEYLPPEMIGFKPYGFSVDWWTFGVLVYELVAGVTPFFKYTDNLVVMYTKICQGVYEKPSYFSSELSDLVEGLLDTQMATRLGNRFNGCNDIKNHDFFRSVNWRAMLAQEILPPFRPHLLYPSDTSYFKRHSNSRIRASNERSQTDLYPEFFSDF